jgi:hypothetical protein
VTSSGSKAFQDAAQVSFPVQHSDDLERFGLWPVDNRVIRIADQSPKAQRTRRKIGAGMAAKVSLGEKSASIVDGLFYAISGIFAIVRDVGSNVEDVGSR